MLGRGTVFLDGVRIPAGALIGPAGFGVPQRFGGVNVTRPLLALTGVACARLTSATGGWACSAPRAGSPLPSRLVGRPTIGSPTIFS
jgi:cyclohexanecarboxyl-CoA dehydrogenase